VRHARPNWAILQDCVFSRTILLQWWTIIE
jgi:hypothetical protein